MQMIDEKNINGDIDVRDLTINFFTDGREWKRKISSWNVDFTIASQYCESGRKLHLPRERYLPHDGR